MASGKSGHEDLFRTEEVGKPESILINLDSGTNKADIGQIIVMVEPAALVRTYMIFKTTT